jgi:hypothetical protein
MQNLIFGLRRELLKSREEVTPIFSPDQRTRYVFLVINVM